MHNRMDFLIDALMMWRSLGSMHNRMDFLIDALMMWRMCIRRINHFFYNYKGINPFCRFCDRFQYIYLHQSFNLLMECFLQMYRYFPRSVLCWNCIRFQSQLVRFTWEFAKTLEHICIGRFHLFLSER